jgi:hypothetical protein
VAFNASANQTIGESTVVDANGNTLIDDFGRVVTVQGSINQSASGSLNQVGGVANVSFDIISQSAAGFLTIVGEYSHTFGIITQDAAGDHLTREVISFVGEFTQNVESWKTRSAELLKSIGEFETVVTVEQEDNFDINTILPVKTRSLAIFAAQQFIRNAG